MNSIARLILGLLIASLGHSGLAAKESPARSKNSQPELADKQADLGEIRQKINTLRKELSSSEESRDAAADRLRESEKRISNLQRELQELSEQRGQTQKKLQSLEQQAQELGNTLNQQQSQLEKLLHKQYLRGNPDSLQLLLNGDNPNQLARDLYYLSAVAQTRAELVGQISTNLERKKALAADAKERSEELAHIESEQQKRHTELQKQRQERQALYAQMSEKVKAQRKTIGELQQDEKRMSQLIDRLTKMIAAQAAQAAKAAAAAKAAEAARAAEAAKQAAAREREKETRREKAGNKTTETAAEKSSPRPAPPPEPAKTKSPEAENVYEPMASDGNFLRQRGGMRLPVRGTISGRFGGARDGGGTWRGLFIRAGNGSEVKSVANGRIVFADWMRGFGNLIIVDHGDAYLTIYGNNDSLLKRVGQSVHAGDTIATVGNSGGNPESGLYFELRHQGQPIDPMKWASLK